MQQKLIAEAFGTFCLVFVGTGAIVNSEQLGAPSHEGVALAFGLIVLAMIYAIGKISGAHINPAVTLGFWAAGRIPARQVAPYIAVQLLGAVVASLCVYVLFPDSATLGATLPTVTLAQTFAIEVILTFVLMYVILKVSTGAKEEGVTAAMAVGATVMLSALYAGPLTGASMNPARSLGPAVVSGQLDALWLYLVAPCLGAWLATHLCCATSSDDCCDGCFCKPTTHTQS